MDLRFKFPEENAANKNFSPSLFKFQDKYFKESISKKN